MTWKSRLLLVTLGSFVAVGFAPAGLAVVTPVSDPTVAHITHLIPGTTPIVFSHPNCTVTTAIDYAEIFCGPLWPVSKEIAHARCLWPEVTVTAFTKTVKGESSCLNFGASASATAAFGPATDFAITLVNDDLPWRCIGDFRTPGATGTVTCERGVDP